jgi:hypothetical protein
MAAQGSTSTGLRHAPDRPSDASSFRSPISRSGHPGVRRIVIGLALTGLAVCLTTGGPVSAVAAAAPPTASAATPAPAGGGLSTAGAVALVKGRGYAPANTSNYDPNRTLSTIIGVWAASADGHPQQAFFFHQGRFVAADAPESSADITWVWSTDDTVALQYQLYRPDDPMCCPSGGAATVRFTWSGTALKPLDPLPSTDWDAPLGRR